MYISLHDFLGVTAMARTSDNSAWCDITFETARGKFDLTVFGDREAMFALTDAINSVNTKKQEAA